MQPAPPSLEKIRAEINAQIARTKKRNAVTAAWKARQPKAYHEAQKAAARARYHHNKNSAGQIRSRDRAKAHERAAAIGALDPEERSVVSIANIRIDHPLYIANGKRELWLDHRTNFSTLSTDPPALRELLKQNSEEFHGDEIAATEKQPCPRTAIEIAFHEAAARIAARAEHPQRKKRSESSAR
jgi:hypothetical protein